LYLEFVQPDTDEVLVPMFRSSFMRPAPTTLRTVCATTPIGLLLLLPSLPFPTSCQWSLLFRHPWRWRQQVENIDDCIYSKSCDIWHWWSGHLL